MHLVTFSESNTIRIGILDVLLSEIVDVSRVDSTLGLDMLSLIERGEQGLSALKKIQNSYAERIPLGEVKLLAPIPVPRRNIICVGKNYREHVQEVQASFAVGDDVIPKAPIFFTKATTAVIATDEAIPASDDPTESVDYEGELGVIIGRGGKAIEQENAKSHIFGYTIINDVTSRRLQKKHHQWYLGKSLDGFCPMGPSIVIADDQFNISNWCIETRVNNELRQQGSVNQMIFNIERLIETLSQYMTLLPGDIIATGTPAGVGMGFSPPKFLTPGDRVEITIDPIGCLTNHVE